jgi:hypothetical protein
MGPEDPYHAQRSLFHYVPHAKAAAAWAPFWRPAMTMDFYFYYAAARLVLAGKNPWNYAEYGSEVLKYLPFIGQPFPAPPWGCWTWVWLGFFDPQASLVIWQSFILIAAFLVPFLYQDGFRPAPSVPAYLLASAITLTSYPWIKTFFVGQPIVLLMFIAWGMTCAFNKRRHFRLGVLAALSTIRLQLFLPLYCYLLSNSRVRHDPWFWVGAAVGVAAQFAFMMAVLTPSPSDIFVSLGSTAAVRHAMIPTATIPSLIGRFTGSFGVILFVSCIAAVLAPFFCFGCYLFVSEFFKAFLV